MNVVQYYSGLSKISTKTDGLTQNRVHLPQCQSTNDYLQKLLNEGNLPLEEGYVVSTDFQTAGRGQRGNTWVSEAGQNLLFSVLLRPNFLSAQRAFWLSAAAAVAVAKALEKFVPEVRVKWPNDILINGLKIGGLLIENTVSGQNLDQSIVGLGLNINQTHLISTATSLAKERGQPLEREEIFGEILLQISMAYLLLQQEGWEKVRSAYYGKLYKMAVPHDFHLPDGQRFRAVLKGISDQGELILLTQEAERRFWFKEVGF